MWSKPFAVAMLGSVSVMALVGMAAEAQSQETTTTVETSESDVTEAKRYETITVTARKREESLLDVPDSISVFGADVIEAAEINEVADFAQLTPGVVTQQGFQGGDRPIIVFRGVGQIGGNAPSVVLLSDGIYLPAGDPLRNQLFDIEQIEVVKGPQGALYGRDTIGGVINVITKAPGDNFEGSGQVSIGSKDEVSVAGAVNVPLVEGKLYGRLSGSYLETDGFFKNLAGTDQEFREEHFLRGRLYWAVSDTVNADLRVSLNSFENGSNAAYYATSGDSRIDDVGGILNAVDFEDHINDREVFDAALKVEADLGFATLTSISQYVDSDNTLIQDADFALSPGIQIVRTSDTLYSALSQELRLTSRADQPVRWIAGVFAETSESDFSFSDEEIEVGLGNLGGRATEAEGNRLGVFAQVDIDLTDRLTATGALRYDNDEQTQILISGGNLEREQNTERVSPKASLSYRFSDTLTGYVTYGEGFRSGGFDAASAIPFDAEVLKSIEVGTKGVFLDGRLRADAAIYKIEYSDQQVASVITDPDTGNLITTTSNLGESELSGVELNLSAILTDNFEVFFSADAIDAEITAAPGDLNLGNRTPFSTDYTATLGGQYTTALNAEWDMLARAQYYYQGTQAWNQANTLEQSPYGLLSARVAVSNDRWTLALSGENILDEEFNDQVFELLPMMHFAHGGLPARWRATLSAKF